MSVFAIRGDPVRCAVTRLIFIHSATAGDDCSWRCADAQVHMVVRVTEVAKPRLQLPEPVPAVRSIAQLRALPRSVDPH